MPWQTLILLLSFLLASTAGASQDQNYGLGGATSGRVSGVTAEADNPYAALYNPALIAAQDRPLFAFSTSVTGADYQPLHDVLVDSPTYRTRSAQTLRDDYQLPGTHEALWAVGFTNPIFLAPLHRTAGLGVTLSGPYSKLRSFSASTPYDFYSLRYGGSDSQFKGTLAASLEVWPEHLYAGVGLSLFITSSGDADATLASPSPTGRLNVDIGLNTALVAGLFFKDGKTAVGLTYRQAINPQIEQKFKGVAQVGRGDGSGTIDLPFTFRTSLYYEPQVLEWEIQHQWSAFKASAGVSYQFWSQYQPPYLVVDALDANQQLQTTQLPAIALRNTWNPRVSLEYGFFEGRLAVSAGYQYRPTPAPDLSGGANFLDCNTHVVGLSVRHTIPAGSLLPWRTEWGLFGQYHRMVARTVEKAAADVIGSPRYDISGNAYAYGLSIQAEW